jgi:hypothetical protein
VTASRSRRRSSTIVALIVSVLALVAVGVFGVIGARTLADSTAGQLADGQQLTMPLQRLPFTPTALIGVVDEDGRLTSAAVGVLEPDGVGGSLIVLAASADASSGNNTVLVPLDADLELNGPTAFREAAERLTGLSFDVAEIVDERRFVQIVTPLGDLPTLMPFALRDSSTEERWAAGELVLSSASAARALTARNDSIADWYLEPNRVAVWEAVADRVGAGVGSIAPIASDQDLPEIATLDEFVRRLFAAPVETRALSFVVIDENRLDEELSDDLAGAFGRADIDAVVAHNRSETLMVFGAIAPGRLGAPIDGPTFRVVSGFADADLADLGLNRSDLLKLSLDRLLFKRTNVLAVADLPGAGAPEVTQFRVADPLIVDDVIAVFGDLFGPSEVTVADVAIEGVDIELELGRSMIETLRGETDDVVAGSGGDASTETNPDDDNDADG